MRPLKLTVAGLHSYKEPVTVDFDDLGRYGLFGIFGPIGSGKSTLLDAMTLALYGLVDRVATRSRKGLVNLGCDRCEVRLAFAVDSGAGAEHYEVHRIYRDVEGVAQRVASRLVRTSMAPGEPKMVLADKERDVNSAVEEVVGLSAEDFMRAVVLPQGRFLQLLHLKGSERRQMLQRIFRLHAYGGGIRRQVSERQQVSQTELANARGELQGLGDASRGAVARSKRVATMAEKARMAAHTTHELHVRRHDEAGRRRARFERLAEARTELANHRHDGVEVLAIAAELAEAERVGPLVQPTDRWRSAQGRLESAAARASLAAREVQEGHRALRAAKKSATAAAQALRAQAPELQREAAQLEQAAVRIQELDHTIRRIAVLDTDVADQRSRQAALNAGLEAAAIRVSDHETARRELKRAHRKTQVAAEDRQRGQRAARAADALKRAQSLVSEARRDQDDAAQRAKDAAQHLSFVRISEADARKAHALATAAAAELERQPGWLDDEALSKLEASLASVHRRETLCHERRTELEVRERAAEAASVARDLAAETLATTKAEAKAAREVRRGAERAAAAADAAEEAERRDRMAADLAKSLQPETPCVVCGSPHHPAPAAQREQGAAAAAAEAHKEGRRRAVERQEAAVSAHAAAVAAHAAATDREASALAALALAKRSLEEVQVENAEGVAEVRGHIEANRALRNEHTLAAQAVQRAAVELERSSIPVAAAKVRAQESRAAADQGAVLLRQRQQEEGRAWSAFDVDRGELTLFDIPNVLAQLEQRDREADALFGQLEANDKQLVQAVADRDELRAELTELERGLAQADERMAGLEERRRTLTEELALQPGSSDAVAALEQVRQTLAALEVAADTCAADLTAQQEAHTLLERAKLAADTGEKSARVALREAHEHVLAALAHIEEPPAEDLEAQLVALTERALDDATMTAHRLRVATWRERDAALATRVDLLGEGAGADVPPPNDEEWQALTEALHAATATLDQAREQASATSRAATELAARSPRWHALTETAERLDRELGRLKELGLVLRGDRFVEYVANDHLTELAARATQHLVALTGGRYALELADDAAFQVRDADAGGLARPVHTLSGGEAFLTALSLALALSTQVQARSSRPLGFFFLDEGFGTLDPEALDRVMSAIEGLRDDARVIGLISHVPAVRERVPRYLWVESAGPLGRGGSSVDVRDN